MNPKLHLLKHALGMGTMLGCVITFLAMFLVAGPGDMCETEVAPLHNNYFGEYWLEIILFVNAILYGVGMLVWHIRIYKRQTQPEEEDEWE